jgi:hypothetical protein
MYPIKLFIFKAYVVTVQVFSFYISGCLDRERIYVALKSGLVIFLADHLSKRVGFSRSRQARYNIAALRGTTSLPLSRQ